MDGCIESNEMKSLFRLLEISRCNPISHYLPRSVFHSDRLLESGTRDNLKPVFHFIFFFGGTKSSLNITIITIMSNFLFFKQND